MLEQAGQLVDEPRLRLLWPLLSISGPVRVGGANEFQRGVHEAE